MKNKTAERSIGTDMIYEVGINAFLRPLKELLEDDTVTEIMALGADSIYVERGGRLEKTEVAFDSESSLLAAVNTIAQFCGKTIADDTPIIDGHLPDGSRVCIVLPPITDGLISLNIRKFSQMAENG